MDHCSRNFSEPNIRTPSIYSQPDIDEDTHSILSTAEVARKHGFASEEAYLLALRRWVLSKSFVSPDPKYNLPGFYGRKTVDDMIRDRQGKHSVMIPALNAVAEKSAVEKQRRREDDQLSLLSQREHTETVRRTGKRKNSLTQWLARRRTVGSIGVAGKVVQEADFPVVPVTEPERTAELLGQRQVRVQLPAS